MKRYSIPFNASKSAAVVLLIILLIGSCKKETGDMARLVASDEAIPGVKLGPPDIVVQAGSSIQAAIDNASAGDVIHIQPGTYLEALDINTADLTLVGLSNENGGVVLQNPGTAEDGIRVRADGDGFELYNITIKDFLENGVIMIRADNFVLRGVNAVNCGEYGLFPIRSNHGLIEHCTASGHTDSGIYTGQSDDIELSHNRVFDNTIGLEIENCSDIVATNNQCYGNVAGMLVVLLPGLQTTVSSNIDISRNHVYENNKPNTVDPADGFEAFVPSGSGILIVGTDNTTVQKNTVKGNNFLGIAVASSLTLGALAGLPPEAFAGIEPNPDGTRVIDNVANTNGTVQPALPFPAVDLLWDGSGTNNCWLGNNYKTSFPAQLPACN